MPPSEEERSEYETLRARASTLNILPLTPLQFLDHASIIHNSTLKPKRAVIYDKITFLTLLFHANTVLLIVHKPQTGAKGWKPPSVTYNAENMHSIGAATISDAFEASLKSILRLGRQNWSASLVAPLHSPRFGTLRIPGQGMDSWVMAQIYDLWPPQAAANLAGWRPDVRVVHAMRWWSEDMVRRRGELDEITREILGEAFKGWRENEIRVDRAMRELN